MKAWIAWTPGEYAIPVHGETASKAKVMAQMCDPGEDFQYWTDIRVRRLPECDGKPLLAENLIEAGFVYDEMTPEEMIELDVIHCNCELCRGVLKEWNGRTKKVHFR